MSIVLTLTDPSLLESLEPLGDISDILNPITENVISVNIIPCILQLSVLAITSYLCYICLWRINIQSALSARHRQTHMSFACKGYQFLWPYHSLQRSIFAAFLVDREPTELLLYLNMLSSVASEALLFAYFYLLLSWHLQDCQYCLCEVGLSEVLTNSMSFKCAPTIMFWDFKWWWSSHNAMEAVEMGHLLGKCSLVDVKEWQAELKLRSTKKLTIIHAISLRPQCC